MSSDTDDDLEMSEEENSSGSEMDQSEQPKKQSDKKEPSKVYLPGKPLKKGEELVCDESAYVMLHEAQTGSPCLSFDVIRNPWFKTSGNFPMTAYLVAGTQAPETHTNSIIVMKMSNLHKTDEKDSDDDDDDDDDESDDEDNSKSPVLKSVMLNHMGCVNRVRSFVHGTVALAAAWSELGRVNIWDVSTPLRDTDASTLSSNERKYVKPLFSFKGHLSEGYGLDWSPIKKGMLASGDCKHGIHIWHVADATWLVDQRPLVGHTESVEDLQWSPIESHILASCSVDRSVRIWDIRSPSNEANKLTVENAHDLDVNVISWNRNEPLLVSGGDDGVLNLWDLRLFKTGGSVASFKHHTQPITSVEWHPTDPTVFASGGADNQIVLWDIALEEDVNIYEEGLENVPHQLLFIHQGQTDIKELHWHPDYLGTLLSTAHSGFNVFKTISV